MWRLTLLFPLAKQAEEASLFDERVDEFIQAQVDSLIFEVSTSIIWKQNFSFIVNSSVELD